MKKKLQNARQFMLKKVASLGLRVAKSAARRAAKKTTVSQEHIDHFLDEVEDVSGYTAVRDGHEPFVPQRSEETPFVVPAEAQAAGA